MKKTATAVIRRRIPGAPLVARWAGLNRNPNPVEVPCA